MRQNFIALTVGAALSWFAAPAFAVIYDVSGTFTTLGGYTTPGSANIINSGSINVSGRVQTDTDAPGYSILGGDMTLLGDINLTALGVTVDFRLDLADGVPSDAGVVFHSGTVCVANPGSASCEFGEFAVGVPPITSVDFSSNNTFLGQQIAGFALTGGAGGESFTVAQPGGVTPVLGPDPSDWAKASGFVSVLGVDSGTFVEGSVLFTRIEQPNLVVVQVDDLSVEAFEVLLEGGWLPNIESELVDAGVSFANSYVTTPEGSPSRATLLTGQYAHNHGVFSNLTPRPLEGGITWEGWLPNGADPGREGSTLATWLQDAGYRTGFVGKYLSGYGLLGPVGVADPASHVPAGWDEWQALIADSASWMYDYYFSDNGTAVNFGSSEADYQTDVVAQKAADFIATSDGEPFFLLVAPGAARTEITDAVAFVTGNDPLAPLSLGVRAAPRYAHLVDGDPANGEMPALPMDKPSFNAAQLAGKASCPRALPPVAPALVTDPFCVAEHPLLDAAALAALSRQYQTTLAAMLAVDDLVGTVLDALETGESADNTVIVFTSDNGRMWGEHRLFDRKVAYEESIRVPLVVRAPGGRAGVVESALVINNDLAPTLAELGGADTSDTPDGTSLVPLIAASPATTWREREHFLVEHWYLRSLLKHDAPTYLAWRGKIGGGPDFTYIGTRALPDDFDITVSTREFYDLETDPFQQSPVELPQDVGDYFDLLLRVFEGCAGDGCRTIEIP